ncbi:unnamed protein product, partial [Didymodactylos carnosus]
DLVCPSLGSAASYAVIAGSEITNAIDSNITGNVAISPSISLTGFSVIPGISGYIVGDIELGTPLALQAQMDVTIAYNSCAGASMTRLMTGVDMSGLTLPPGVYKFDAAGSLDMPNGILTLSGAGIYIFQFGSSLITSISSQILLTNGATPGCIFWQVGSSATIGLNSQFSGIILAYASITFSGGVQFSGSAFAQNAAVTMISDTIDVQSSCSLG